ncbi:MAG: hypothetical protein IPP64_03680 [Bacteroidetes bacterium]|nr:hypothetical protein [Bacteroidota bacterium]
MSKKHLITLILTLHLGISLHGQRNFLNFDYSISHYKIPQVGETVFGLSEKINRCEGNFIGGSYHIAVRRKHFIGIGMGLSEIKYQKEWQGTFPESNQFGVATVDGKISYWSFPVSYSWIQSRGYRSYHHMNQQKLRFGFTFTYTPSFESYTSVSVTTAGGANQTTFLANFKSNEQAFQHSLTVGLCSQLFLIDNHLKMELEPSAGLGSGFFKETGTNINTVSFGLRCRIGISLKLPRITIEKEIDKGNAEEKKKQLLEKQKQIEEQLNKNKNPK